MPSKHIPPHFTGSDKGLDTCWVDDMAVWWFRATCFHGLKYLCVNREVLKQNFIMKTEMKASNECLYPTDVFLISCGMGCKRITVSDIAYIEANIIIL